MSRKGNGHHVEPVNTTPAWSTVPKSWQDFHGAISPKYEIGSIERDDATGFCYPLIMVAQTVFDAVNAVRPNAAQIALLTRDEHAARDRQPVPLEEATRRGDFVPGRLEFKSLDHKKKYHSGFYVFIDPMALEDPRITATLMEKVPDLKKMLEILAQPMDFWGEHITMRAAQTLPDVAKSVTESERGTGRKS